MKNPSTTEPLPVWGTASMSACATARSIAAQRPRSKLACPLCGASVRGENLRRHLRRAHDAEHLVVAAPVRGLSWRGEDRRLRIVANYLPLLALPILVPIWTASGTSAGMVRILAATVAVATVLPWLASVSKLARARLCLEDDRLSLHWGFGLGRRCVELRGPVCVGSVVRFRPAPHLASYDEATEGAFGGEMVGAGTYLQIGDGRRTITVVSPRGTGFRKHWDPSTWRSGPKRRRWDVTISRTEFVELEYALAELGVLTLRGSSTAAESHVRMRRWR